MSKRMFGMWKHAKTPEEWHKLFLSEFPSGLVDEVYVARLFNNYLPNKQKTIVDFGIGTAREMVWVDKLKNLSQVVGVDYSGQMISFCQKSASLYQHKLICIKDNLLHLKHLPKIIKSIKEPIVYISLVNSLGNFSASERIQSLRQLKRLLRHTDRVVLCLYKRPTLKMKKYLPASFPESAVPGKKIEIIHLAFIIEYANMPFFWHSIIGAGRFPRFWYNRKTNDIVIHTNGKRVVISHRFNKSEIKELARNVSLSIEKLITGKFMYVVVLVKK